MIRHALMLTAAFTATSTQADFITPQAPAGDAIVASSGSEQLAFSGNREWFTADDGSRWTAWAGQKVTVTPDLDVVDGGYRIGVTAKNFGRLGLPSSYDHFRFRVYAGDSNLGVLEVDASDTDWNTGWMDIGNVSGEPVTLKWLNDAYRAGIHDANVGIAGVSFAAVPAPASIAALALAVVGLPRGRLRRDRD